MKGQQAFQGATACRGNQHTHQ